MPPKSKKSASTTVAPTIIVHTLNDGPAAAPQLSIHNATISDTDSDEDEYPSVASVTMHQKESTKPILGDGTVGIDREYADTMMTKDDINKQIAVLDGFISKLQEPQPAASTKRVNKAIENNHKYALNQHLAVRAYFQQRLAGVKKMEASIIVAKEVFAKEAKHSFKAKCIREWADHYLNTGTFKAHKQGKHPKTKSIILKPEVQELLRQRMLQVSEIDRTPSSFMTLLNTSLLAEIPDAPVKVSKETARRWLNLIGFHSSNPILPGPNYYFPPHASI